MSDWKIKSKSQTTESAILQPATLGFYPDEYEFIIEHQETGETRRVTAFSEEHLGKRIADGEFDED